MNITTKLFLASVFALSIVAPVQAQSSKQGDYYAPGQTTPQQATPGQEQKIRQGDYYAPGQTTPQHATPGQEKKYSRVTTTSRIASRANGHR